MHSLPFFIWLVIAAGFVISTIRKAQRQRQQAAPPAQPGGAMRPPPRSLEPPALIEAPRPTVIPVTPGVPESIQAAMAQLGASLAPPAPPKPSAPARAPRQAPKAAPAPAPAPAVLAPHPEHRPLSIRRRSLAGLFETRKAFVRAIVAAEVLGKPVALRDE